MDIVSAFASQLASNPQIQAIVLGMLVKIGVDRLKKLFVSLDADGTKEYKVPVQLLVVVCSGLATIGDLYVDGKLSTYDPSLLMNFLTVTLPIYLNAMGIHLFSKNAKQQLEKKANAPK